MNARVNTNNLFAKIDIPHVSGWDKAEERESLHKNKKKRKEQRKHL